MQGGLLELPCLTRAVPIKQGPKLERLGGLDKGLYPHSNHHTQVSSKCKAALAPNHTLSCPKERPTSRLGSMCRCRREDKPLLITLAKHIAHLLNLHVCQLSSNVTLLVIVLWIIFFSFAWHLGMFNPVYRWVCMWLGDLPHTTQGLWVWC